MLSEFCLFALICISQGYVALYAWILGFVALFGVPLAFYSGLNCCTSCFRWFGCASLAFVRCLIVGLGCCVVGLVCLYDGFL